MSRDGDGVPDGGRREMPWLMPVLTARGGVEAVAFYERALGAEAAEVLTAPDGAVAARMRTGGAPFMVSDESPEHGNHSPPRLGGSTVRLALVVADPDAHARAVAAGAGPVHAVDDQPWGWRQGRVEDAFGHQWEIGRPLPGVRTA